MTNPSLVYEECRRLFATYPLAVRVVNRSGTMCSMTLFLDEESAPKYFSLSYHGSDGEPFYSLCQWGTRNVVDIDADDSAPIPGTIARAVIRGIPIPRHGSLLGWKHEGTITTLVAFYASRTSTCSEPCWAVMPRAGTPEAEWPPFRGEDGPIRRFWNYFQMGKIVPLDKMIAGTSDTVFWVNTKPVLGWDCCAVARDIGSPEGHTLLRGRYVYYQALRSAKPVPPLAALLSYSSKTDLAPRFWRSGSQQCLATGE